MSKRMEIVDSFVLIRAAFLSKRIRERSIEVFLVLLYRKGDFTDRNRRVFGRVAPSSCSTDEDLDHFDLRSRPKQQKVVV